METTGTVLVTNEHNSKMNTNTGSHHDAGFPFSSDLPIPILGPQINSAHEGIDLFAEGENDLVLWTPFGTGLFAVYAKANTDLTGNIPRIENAITTDDPDEPNGSYYVGDFERFDDPQGSINLNQEIGEITAIIFVCSADRIIAWGQTTAVDGWFMPDLSGPIK